MRKARKHEQTNGRLILKVEVFEDEYETTIQAGTKGDEAIQAIALLIHNTAERERIFSPGYSSETILRSVEHWLRILEDEH